MDSIPSQLLLQVILILVNAFFAASEIAVLSLNVTQLELSLIHILLKDCLCRFANFTFMKNKEVHFEHCDLYQASIIETNLKKTTFHECNLQQCEIQHASLYQIDLSSCDLTNLITTVEDIQGAIIDSFQAASPVSYTHLLAHLQIKPYDFLVNTDQVKFLYHIPMALLF